MSRASDRKTFEIFDASRLRVGIVVAQFNRDITEAMLARARKRLADYRVPPGHVTVLRVAGSIELPLALQELARTKHYQALAAIGCIIRGETAHFDYVCKIAAEGILRVMLDHHIPIGFGVLATENHRQALARLDAGAHAMDAALYLARLLKTL